MPISLEEDEIDYINTQYAKRQAEREKIQRELREQERKNNEEFRRVYDR